MILFLSPSSEPNLGALIAASQWANMPWLHIDSRLMEGVKVRLDGAGCASELCVAGRTISCEAVTGVWTRGLGIEPVPKVASAENLVQAEWLTLLRALPDWLPRARWLNPLDAIAQGNRLRQMREAGRLGLKVPRSIITTDRGHAREWLLQEGAVIIKRLSQGRASENADRVLFAQRLTQADEALFDQMGPGPVLLQSVEPKVAELRTIVVGDTVFTAAFSAERHAETCVDTRLWSATDDTYYGFRLDDETAAKAVALTKALGLGYGAIDFLVAADGSVTFLEVNTAGQWGWVEAATGLPIASTIVDALSCPVDKTPSASGSPQLASTVLAPLTARQ